MNETLPLCAGWLWLKGHTTRIATLLRWQNISLCALRISCLSYYNNHKMQRRYCNLTLQVLYRVTVKSVKYFKNLKQTNYSTDHGSSYDDRERKTLQGFFYIFRRCSMCPPLVIRQTSMRQFISFHTRVTISRSIRAKVVVIRLRKSGD